MHRTAIALRIGGVSGADSRNEEPAPLLIATKPFQRGTVPFCDVRFKTFKNTGDYDTADGEARFAKRFLRKLASALHPHAARRSGRHRSFWHIHLGHSVQGFPSGI